VEKEKRGVHQRNTSKARDVGSFRTLNLMRAWRGGGRGKKRYTLCKGGTILKPSFPKLELRAGKKELSDERPSRKRKRIQFSSFKMGKGGRGIIEPEDQVEWCMCRETACSRRRRRKREKGRAIRMRATQEKESPGTGKDSQRRDGLRRGIGASRGGREDQGKSLHRRAVQKSRGGGVTGIPAVQKSSALFLRKGPGDNPQTGRYTEKK